TITTVSRYTATITTPDVGANATDQQGELHSDEHAIMYVHTYRYIFRSLLYFCPLPRLFSHFPSVKAQGQRRCGLRILASAAVGLLCECVAHF
ncbi:unnamed protein product, partial [Scytosiphon promiscuus]